MAGYFIKESVNNYLKQMKTRQLASKDTYDWYNSLYNYNIGQISQIKGRFPFEPGKIYVFRYKPITKELPFYDKNPIILCLGKRINIDGSVVFAGINLKYIPWKIRVLFLTKIYHIYRNKIAINQRKYPFNAKRQYRLKLSYDFVEDIIKRYGADFAIRNYKRNRCFKVGVISYENWYRAIFFENYRTIKGMNITKIYRNFYKKFKTRDKNLTK